MLTDRYDLALSTASAAARDAYVQATDLALTFYPGAAEAYDQAIAADPGFAGVRPDTLGSVGGGHERGSGRSG